MLKQRVITALILVAILLPALFASVAWPFALLTLVLIAAAGWEWGRLNGAGAGSLVMGALLAAVCAAALWAGWGSAPPRLVWWLAMGVWVLGGTYVLRGGVAGWPGIPAGLRWVIGLVLLWTAWLALAAAKTIGVNFILSVFCLVWAADIAAYFGGRAFGKRKLAPAISPGKSWAGVWSGMLGALVLAAFWLWLDTRFQMDSVSIYTRVLGRFGPRRAGGRDRVPGRDERGRRPVRIAGQARRRRQGQQQPAARPRRGARPGRRAAAGVSDRDGIDLDMTSPTASGRQRVCILGATGSVGANTLDVISRHSERFEVVALTAHSRVDLLLAQCVQWRPRYAAMSDAAQASDLRRRLADADCPTEVLDGAQALCDLASHPDVDAVMAAIVGAAGLAPCLAAAHAGKRLLLANKEALVVGGSLFMNAVNDGGATLLPIDSEHSAIFQCLPEDRAGWAARIDHILLTSSGGPFRRRDPATLSTITPDEACAHPNFAMGRKISVDSATMMNKALEVIEARWLFDLAPAQIQVVIHPQQIVHSMVVCRDNSVLAQLGTPDMRVPIAYGLSFPERIESGASRLDFGALAALTFEAPDFKRYPGLALAWETLHAAEGSTTVLNAANETAVAAFLAERIRFDQIHGVIAEALARVDLGAAGVDSLDALLDIDRRAREQASAFVKGLRP